MAHQGDCRRRLADSADRFADTQITQAIADLGCFCGIASQFVEVIVDAHLFDLQHVAPDRAHALFPVGAWRGVACRERRAVLECADAAR